MNDVLRRGDARGEPRAAPAPAARDVRSQRGGVRGGGVQRLEATQEVVEDVHGGLLLRLADGRDAPLDGARQRVERAEVQRLDGGDEAVLARQRLREQHLAQRDRALGLAAVLEQLGDAGSQSLGRASLRLGRHLRPRLPGSGRRRSRARGGTLRRSRARGGTLGSPRALRVASTSTVVRVVRHRLRRLLLLQPPRGGSLPRGARRESIVARGRRSAENSGARPRPRPRPRPGMGMISPSRGRARVPRRRPRGCRGGGVREHPPAAPDERFPGLSVHEPHPRRGGEGHLRRRPRRRPLVVLRRLRDVEARHQPGERAVTERGGGDRYPLARSGPVRERPEPEQVRHRHGAVLGMASLVLARHRGPEGLRVGRRRRGGGQRDDQRGAERGRHVEHQGAAPVAAAVPNAGAPRVEREEGTRVARVACGGGERSRDVTEKGGARRGRQRARGRGRGEASGRGKRARSRSLAGVGGRGARSPPRDRGRSSRPGRGGSPPPASTSGRADSSAAA